MVAPPEPGFYEGVPFDQYLSWPYISNSGLSGIERSALHWKHRKPIEETDAMRLGTLCHAGQLEPASIFKSYIVMPDLTEGITTKSGEPAKNPRATSEYERRVGEWESKYSAGKKVVPQADFDAMVGMVAAMNANHRSREWLTDAGPVEVSMVWDDPDTGIRCKGRIDKLSLHRGRIVDVKSTRDCVWFPTQIADRRYYRQGAFYIDGVMVLTGEVCTFGIVAVENVDPHGVMAAMLAADDIDLGHHEFKEALHKIAEANRTRLYSGYENPEQWELPPWRKSRVEPVTLTIGGEAITL